MNLREHARQQIRHASAPFSPASKEKAAMRRSGLVVVGAVVVLFGLLFTLQGIGVISGSSMSNTTFWSVAGPLVILVGLAVAGIGIRRGRD
jgi:hypothetical protein